MTTLPLKAIVRNNKITALGQFQDIDKIPIKNLEYSYIKINDEIVPLGNNIILSDSVIRLSDDINSTSISSAATANAVKTVYDFANTKLNLSGGNITGNVNVSECLQVSNSKFIANTVMITDSNNIIDRVSGANTINYYIEMKQDANIHSCHLLVVDNMVKEYCNVQTASIGTFTSTNVNNITLSLERLNSLSDVTVKFLRTTLS